MAIYNYKNFPRSTIHNNKVINYILGIIREGKYFIEAIFKRKQTKKIFIVYGLGRSGSSAFCEVLSQKYNAINFNELFQYRYFSPKNLILNAAKTSSKPIIIKILAHQINSNRIDIDLFKNISQICNCEVEYINLKRNSFHQSLSVIFSKETQIWHKKKSEKKLNKIEINEKSYINALESIKSNINTETLMQEAISNEFNIRKVNYEDVISSIQLANTSYKKLSNNGVTDRITNTDALKDIHDKFFK